MSDVRYLTAGDTALVMEFGTAIDESVNRQVKRVYDALRARPVKGIFEAVPTFRSLLIYYNPCQISYEKLVKKLKKLEQSSSGILTASKKIIHIPVLYGGEYGEDIADVAAYTKLTEQQIISLHSEKEYLIYMLGFLPGFAYLGGLDPRLHTPRLKNPRTKIPQGSVGIGGEQTGIYPLASPGGWRLIGRTPLKPYDPARKEPFLYQAGDYIKFDPVTAEEYKQIESLVEEGKYTAKEEVR
jgi:KipI family sensor histidine kinase inhibitor